MLRFVSLLQSQRDIGIGELNTTVMDCLHFRVSWSMDVAVWCQVTPTSMNRFWDVCVYCI